MDFNFNFDLNLYKTFYTVAKTGSFSKAANELYVSQPSISYAIKSLEKELDTQLFYRNSKGITLTDEAKELLKYIENSYTLLSIAEKTIKERKDLSYGTITIGVQSHIGQFFLFPYIEKFHSMFPGININVVSRNTAEMLQFLQSNKIDFMIDTSPIDSIYNNLEIVPLYSLENCFITKNPIRELECKGEVSLKDLEGYPMILPVERSTPRKQLEETCKKSGIKLNPFMTIETTEMLIRSVESDIGIGYVLKEAVRKKLHNKELYEIPVKDELPKLQLNLVYVENFLTYTPRKFMELIKKDYIK